MGYDIFLNAMTIYRIAAMKIMNRPVALAKSNPRRYHLRVLREKGKFALHIEIDFEVN